MNFKSLADQKQSLVHQLSLFEKDSLEIQSKVRRGIEAQQDADSAKD